MWPNATHRAVNAWNKLDKPEHHKPVIAGLAPESGFPRRKQTRRVMQERALSFGF
jgi:hypothetical protein